MQILFLGTHTTQIYRQLHLEDGNITNPWNKFNTAYIHTVLSTRNRIHITTELLYNITQHVFHIPQNKRGALGNIKHLLQGIYYCGTAQNLCINLLAESLRSFTCSYSERPFLRDIRKRSHWHTKKIILYIPIYNIHVFLQFNLNFL